MFARASLCSQLEKPKKYLNNLDEIINRIDGKEQDNTKPEKNARMKLKKIFG